MPQQVAKPADGVPPGYSSELIDVKFREGTDVEPPEETLPPGLAKCSREHPPGIQLIGRTAERNRRRQVAAVVSYYPQT